MHSCDRHDLRSIGWWVGKSSATRLQPAILWKGRLWIPAHLPDLVTTFLLAEVAHLQQNCNRVSGSDGAEVRPVVNSVPSAGQAQA